ncbi:MAG: translation elongation factor 4 [Patescibacteria group bacterium]|nr:translation elongation factor 4 [Patescibacteria group bacterium]
MEKNPIRNFAIIAHIDHGKSTLADRILEITGAINASGHLDQFLDQNPISRERGITIKLAPIRLNYALNGAFYTLNLIDTPGHVDFSYEVSRSLACCEGAILLVDATKGIQAQTLSHGKLAQKLGLTLIPVVNKIDSPLAQINQTKKQIYQIFKLAEKDILEISAKTGAGVKQLLEEVIIKIPPPKPLADEPFKALVFDSVYDNFSGVMTYLRIFSGQVKKDDRLTFLNSKTSIAVRKVGIFNPSPCETELLEAGQVGFVATGLKDISLCRVGDTLGKTGQKTTAFPGFNPPKPMVYAGLYPVNNNDFPKALEAVKKLALNDSSLTFSEEYSQALGRGLRLGFLGLLHAEIVKERLEREFSLELFFGKADVAYEVVSENNKILTVQTAGQIPQSFKEIRQPYILATIFVPENYFNNVLKLCQQNSFSINQVNYLSQTLELELTIPLSALLGDFFSQLKSVTSGFASLDYSFMGYKPFNGAKMDVLLNNQPKDVLSQVVEKDKAEMLGRQIAERLKNVIPRQQYKIVIQTALGSHILARAEIPPFRKDVLAHLYGGDRTRKDKLLEAQKKGKKRMKLVGQVELPQEAFVSLWQK